jgi:hypothetical protein
MPTGDPNMPEYVRIMKKAKYKIIDKSNMATFESEDEEVEEEEEQDDNNQPAIAEEEEQDDYNQPDIDIYLEATTPSNKNSSISVSSSNKKGRGGRSH